MSTTKSAEERTVESADDHSGSPAENHSASPTDDPTVPTNDDDPTVSSNDDQHVPPEVLAESIRNKTAALADQGEELADKLDELADEDGQDEIDPAAMMTELLETASDLVAVAHEIEDARLQE